MSKNAQTASRQEHERTIEDALLAALDLRDSIFKIGDEPLIRTMDLLIYALGKVAVRERGPRKHA